MMSIDNHFVHMGKEKVAKVCSSKSTEEIDMRTSLGYVPIRREGHPTLYSCVSPILLLPFPLSHRRLSYNYRQTRM